MDEKLPSNFNAPGSIGSSDGYEPIHIPYEDIYSSDDDPYPAQPMFMPPPEKPKDFQAMAEAMVYEKISSNGASESMDVHVSMIDDNDGHGKATVTIGKDAKKRQFEIPISIKDSQVKIDKAIDLDTNKVIDIGGGTTQLFQAPEREQIFERLDKTYDKYGDFFKGKPNDKKVKTLMRRYPSLTETEAKDYLDYKFLENRGLVYAAAEKVKDNKKTILLGGAAVAGAILLYALMKRREKHGSPPRE
jgi:hypothetical protein